MLKNRLVLIAMASLAVVISGVSTVIFLEESISISDRAETKSTNVSTIQYDFPLHGESKYTSEPVMYLGHIDLTISNLPKVGKTAEVEVTLINKAHHILYPPNYYYDAPQEYLSYGIIITDNFEFVDQTNFNSVGDEHGIVKNVEKLDVGESKTMSATIRAISDGMGYIRSGSTYQKEIHMHVGENETLLKEDYLNLHPEMRPQQQEQRDLLCPHNEPCPDLPPTPEEIAQLEDGYSISRP